MKILILGGKGMAGHMIVSYFNHHPNYDVFYTSRDHDDPHGLYLDIVQEQRLEAICRSLKPDIIINCVGILNENAEKNPSTAILANSWLPHRLAEFCETYGGSLIHISTDCVFSGNRGDYKEHDLPDGSSVYSRTKALGEVIGDRHLNIRTSIIGPELKKDGIGLFQWFLKQKGEIKGFKNVHWNGVTTLELAKAIDRLIESNIKGIFHLGQKDKISKYELLNLIQKIFMKNDVHILPDEAIVLDRTLVNNRIDVDYQVPSYETMLMELREWMSKK